MAGTFRIVRTTKNCRVLIVVSPENADLRSPDSTCYVHDEWTMEDGDSFFRSANGSGVAAYLSDQNDQREIDWIEPPADPFNSLDEVQAWANDQLFVSDELRHELNLLRAFFIAELGSESRTNSHTPNAELVKLARATLEIKKAFRR